MDKTTAKQAVSPNKRLFIKEGKKMLVGYCFIIPVVLGIADI